MGQWDALASGAGSVGTFMDAFEKAQRMKMERERYEQQQADKIDADMRGGFRQTQQDEIEASRYGDKMKQQEFQNNLDLQKLGLMREDKTAKANEKKEMALSEVAVPGYDLTGEVMPQKGEAAKLREAKGQADAFNQNLEAYKALVQKYGTSEWMGPEAARMASLSTDMKMALKNINSLGVLSQSDLDLLSSQVPDPSSFGSLFTRSATQQGGLDQLKDSSRQKFETKMAGAGYRQQGVSTKKERALEALNDPAATPEERAQAQRILGMP